MFNKAIFTIEFKRNIKGALIWSVSIGLLAFYFFSFFNAIKSNSQSIQQLFTAYPKELIQAFGIDTSMYTSPIGFFNSEFSLMFVIANSIYAVMLGANTIGKELSSRTIIFLLTKSVRRETIAFTKLAVISSVLFLTNVVVGILAYLGAKYYITDVEISIQFFVLFFVAQFIFQFLFLSLGFTLGIILTEGRALAISSGIFIATTFINIFRGLQNAPDWFKYLTPFYYSDFPSIAQNLTLKTPDIFVLSIIALGILAIGFVYFRRMDIET
jgi:ABC-2 type transport system permease protein